MKIGFYSPYLDAFGGGERYVLTLASHWSLKHDVDIFFDNEKTVMEEGSRFSIDLSRVHILPNVFRSNALLDKLIATWNYHVLFVLSDGSIPWTLARHNIVHFQFPVPSLKSQRYKLFRYRTVVCNSTFTKTHLDQAAGRKAIVIYPPVDTGAFLPKTKTKRIVSVGRFSAHHEVKKQHVIIDAFKEGHDSGALRGWELALAGGLSPSDRKYFESIKRDARSYPIRFYPNCDFATLRDLYAKSMVYWHAAGYGQKDPLLMEHFGISTVEAMAAGCVAVVYGYGGQPEIITHGKDGFLWDTVGELLRFTAEAIRDAGLRAGIVSEAKYRASQFDKEIFCRNYDGLLAKIAK